MQADFLGCFTAKLHIFSLRRKKRKCFIFHKITFLCQTRFWVSNGPKSEPSDIFVTYFFLFTGSIFPTSELLTYAGCIWVEELNGRAPLFGVKTPIPSKSMVVLKNLFMVFRPIQTCLIIHQHRWKIKENGLFLAIHLFMQTNGPEKGGIRWKAVQK